MAQQTRRDFMKVGLGGLGMLSLGGATPLFVPKFAHAEQAVGSAVSNDNVLVVVQLSGGNDGLNTLIPVGNDDYKKSRPKIALADGLHQLDDTWALNPGMNAFKSMFDDGKLAIVNACGYPKQNRSHFESMAIWHSADPSLNDTRGWLGHYLDHISRGTQSEALSAVNIGSELPQALVTDGAPAPSINRLQDFSVALDNRTNFDKGLERELIEQFTQAEYENPRAEFFAKQANNAIISADEIRKVAESYQPDANYPGGLGERLKLIARLIAGNFGTRVFYCQMGGFDTHANQVQQHQNLLAQLSNSVKAFYTDLEAKGLDSKVTTMVFSEFGRRVKQNDSQGTDHGAAGPMFVVGPKVKPGLHGAAPSLAADDLDKGDVKFTTDFRRVYSTLLRDWLNVDPSEVLSGEYENLPLFA
ncbi:MAG: DUF1501 domain-containing protein [Planctomycetota bacterium]